MVINEVIKKRTFPGRYQSLALIRDFVVKAAKEAGLAQDDVYEVELSVDEACTNIIEHAYRGESKGKIDCWISIEEAGLRIRLRDYGQPFDPSTIVEPRIDVPLKRLKTRGVGFFLIKKLMDEMCYESNPTGGNLMEMFKKKSGSDRKKE